jgi:gp30
MDNTLQNINQNNLQGGDNKFEIFNYNNLGSVRVQIDNQGNPWFCLLDVCIVLGLTNVTKVSDRLFPEGLTSIQVLSNGGPQSTLFVNEPNLYKVIMGSRKPEAQEFQKWICFEVIPSIRQTGSYNVNEPEISFTNFMFKLAGQVDQNVSDIKNLFTTADRHTQAINNNTQAIDVNTQCINILNEKVEIISNESYLTINGFATFKNVPLTLELAQRLGQIATRTCNERGIFVAPVKHPIWGSVNMYPLAILDEVFRNNVAFLNQ